MHNKYIICNNLINKGMILRCISTIITFIILSIFVKNKFIDKYIYLILAIILLLLDDIDNYFFYYNNYTDLKCYTLNHYQYFDKIYDSISYLIAYLFLYKFYNVDYILFLFIVYRIIGVILLCSTNNSLWLVVFFDFIKEYLLYLFIFCNNYMYMPFFIIWFWL
jgi:hypothetical protein